VPPRWAGGRPLLLTCKPCNDRAGSELDGQAAHREAQHDFLANRAPDRALPAEFTVGDVTTRGDVRRVGDALLLSVVPDVNNPRDLEARTRTLDAWAAGEASDGRMGFRLTERVSVVKARLSWVRAAYLAAFAALGYRYASQSLLDPVRAQLADPAADLLPPLGLYDPDAPPDQRRLFLVQQPHELRSLAVVLGRYTVLLPGLEDLQPVEDLAAALGRVPVLPGSPGRRALQWAGKEVPWPAKPVYALDQ
jgi:hypothetical protein